MQDINPILEKAKRDCEHHTKEAQKLEIFINMYNQLSQSSVKSFQPTLIQQAEKPTEQITVPSNSSGSELIKLGGRKALALAKEILSANEIDSVATLIKEFNKRGYTATRNSLTHNLWKSPDFRYDKERNLWLVVNNNEMRQAG